MKPTDRIIFFITLILSLFVIIFSGLFFPEKKGETVVIEVNGEVYGRYDLKSEKSVNVLEINTKYGYNKIEIENDGVSVTETDCSDRLEVKQGKIKNVGEMLVCLPNRLVIKIEGKAEVDGFAY